MNTVTSLFLGFFVYTRNRSNPVNRSFAVFAFFVALWSLPYILWPLSYTEEAWLLSFRLLHIGAILIPVAYYNFVLCFLGKKDQRGVLLGYLLAGFFLLFSFSPYFIVGMQENGILPYWGQPGILYHFFLIMFFGYAGYSLLLLFSEYRKTQKHNRKGQIACIGIGTLIGFIGGSTNYIMWYDIPFPPVLNILVSMYVFLTAYAIIRHNLLDINVIVKKTVIFAGLFISFFTVFAGITFVLSQLFESFVANRWMALVPSFIVIILAYRPIENFLINITDKHLFQKKYNYKELLKAFTGEVLTVLDLQRLVDLTVEKLVEIIKLESACFFLFRKDTSIFEPVACVGDVRGAGSVWPDSEELREQVFIKKSCFVVDSYKSARLPENLRKHIESYGSSVLIPLMREAEVLGMLSIGKKKSDEEFIEFDIESLMSVAATLSLAITNAMYIEELNCSHLELLESQKREQRAENLVSLGYMVTNLSHELRNPVHVISASVEELLDVIDMDIDMDKLPPKEKETIEYIISKLEKTLARSDKTHAMLESILNAIKVTPEKFVDTDLREMMDEVISRVEPYVKDTNIRIINGIGDGFPKVKVDRVTFEQVFINLITNAIQAFQVAKKGDQMRVSAVERKSSYQIELSDNGPGIPAQDIKRIFEPFYTTKDNLHVYKNGQNSGTGLGLMIVQQTISKHNGSIRVESVEGEGTTFIVELPKTEEEGAKLT